MTRPPRRRGLNDRQVAALRRKAKRYIIADPELRGHYVRVPVAGPCTFAAVARDPYGKQIWATLGTSDVMPIEEARGKAREVVRRIKEGKPAVEPPAPKPDSFKAVSDNWLKRHVEKNGLRTRGEIERCLKKYIVPHWGEREFESIRRSDVTRLLDYVEDEHGSRQADAVLTIVRSITNWHAKRHDNYDSPIVRGMQRADAAGKRDRILDDDELRVVWKATESGTFGALVRTLLLTAQRRDKVRFLRWDDISPDGIWHIRTEEREKDNARALKLPQLALDVIYAQPRFASNPYVFAGRSYASALHGLSDAKASLDEASGVRKWTLHDLRRTARSLMSRAKVSSEHAERVLGHAIRGVEGTYDRYPYLLEKADALERLAGLIERIVNPPAGDNVVPMVAVS